MRRGYRTPGSSSNPMDIRMGVRNNGKEVMRIYSTHPEQLAHPAEWKAFDVPPGYYVELPHRHYEMTVPSGDQKYPVTFIESGSLRRIKQLHRTRFVYVID